VAPDLLLAVLIFAAALLYSSVGHAGASGYLAAMALVGVAPAVMKPTALALNILVASIATWKFARAGCFSRDLFLPFAVTSVPLAFVGGAVTLPTDVYKRIVGLVLLYAAYRLFLGAGAAVRAPVRRPALAIALATGAAIGLLSGLTGVGGGIFLSPLVLLAGWGETREASGVAAAFILVNSVAALVGHSLGSAQFPPALSYWAAAAAVGGWIGASYGSRRLATPVLRRLLAVVLVIAGLKMLTT
jgi:uncharacterized membrane protein YfcA